MTYLKNLLKKEELPIIDFSAQPTILNNILWYAVAETDKNYHFTFYSLVRSRAQSLKKL